MVTSECPGCIGRGTGDMCRQCGQPIPEYMRYSPTMPGPQDNPALDGWAVNLLWERLAQEPCCPSSATGTNCDR